MFFFLYGFSILITLVVYIVSYRIRYKTFHSHQIIDEFRDNFSVIGILSVIPILNVIVVIYLIVETYIVVKYKNEDLTILDFIIDQFIRKG